MAHFHININKKFSNKYNYKITRSKTVITLKFLNEKEVLYSADFALLKDKITHEEVIVRNGNVYVWNMCRQFDLFFRDVNQCKNALCLVIVS